MSWSDAAIRVGKGEVRGEEEFMCIKDSEKRLVNYIVVASQGAATKWTFKIPGMIHFIFNSSASLVCVSFLEICLTVI